MAWINVKDRLPNKDGNYKIKNNAPECNGGKGYCYYSSNTGWDIPELIEDFFQIYYWWE